MNKKQTQTELEAICFMHQRPQEQQEDYMDIYAEEPRECNNFQICPCQYANRFCNTCE